MTTLFRPLLVVAVLALFLTGCGASGGGHDDADVAFATGMVPHHRQAVQMSDVLLTKTGVDGDVVALATKIKAEQAPEIEQMTGWLSAWGAPAADSGGMGGMDGMGGGMMSASEMDALGSAQGRQAQTLFLQGMTRHHEGAIAMANTELAQGKDADAKALAQSIVTSQQAEIDQMKALLAG
ncbi:MAG: DUF305 domain-containing protein [Janthinobacterium lividum]